MNPRRRYVAKSKSRTGKECWCDRHECRQLVVWWAGNAQGVTAGDAQGVTAGDAQDVTAGCGACVGWWAERKARRWILGYERDDRVRMRANEARLRETFTTWERECVRQIVRRKPAGPFPATSPDC
eukprot:2690077-Pleurochrysis_carterae.AAC.2